MKFFTANTLFLTLALVTILSPDFCHAERKNLSLTGSSTVAPLVSEIAQRFEELNPTFRIDVQTGGSSRGIADARRGVADIGMSSRGLYEKELQGIKTHTVAMDGVTFVAHASNGVTSLTKQQAIDIYTGKIKNWKDIGGNDQEITVIDRAKGRSEKDLVTKYLGISAREIDADIVAGENQQCLKLLANNKAALVYLSVGTAEYEVTRGAPLKLLALDGVTASTKTVMDGSFPIVRPLLLITADRPSDEVSQFLNYAVSSQVHDLVKGQAFVPIQ